MDKPGETAGGADEDDLSADQGRDKSATAPEEEAKAETEASEIDPSYQIKGHEDNLAEVTAKAERAALAAAPTEPKKPSSPPKSPDSESKPPQNGTKDPTAAPTWWDGVEDWFGGIKGWTQDWSSDVKQHYSETMKGKEGWDKVTTFFGSVGYGVEHFFEKLFGSEPEKAKEETPIPTRSVSERAGDYFKDMAQLLKEFKLSTLGDKEKDFFQVALALGKEVQATFGVPYQVVVAQACLESGNGTSGLTQKALNCFGMKGSGTSMSSKEYENGEYVSKKSSFKVYGSLRESFMDYGRRLSTSDRYRPAFEFKDNPEAFLTALVDAGYATTPAPEYVRRAEARLKHFGMSLS